MAWGFLHAPSVGAEGGERRGGWGGKGHVPKPKEVSLGAGVRALRAAVVGGLLAAVGARLLGSGGAVVGRRGAAAGSRARGGAARSAGEPRTGAGGFQVASRGRP